LCTQAFASFGGIYALSSCVVKRLRNTDDSALSRLSIHGWLSKITSEVQARSCSCNCLSPAFLYTDLHASQSSKATGNLFWHVILAFFGCSYHNRHCWSGDRVCHGHQRSPPPSCHTYKFSFSHDFHAAFHVFRHPMRKGETRDPNDCPFRSKKHG